MSDKPTDSRRFAFEVLCRLQSEDRSLDNLVAEAISKANLDARDIGFLYEILWGIMRQRGKLDYLIREFSNIRYHHLDYRLKNILRLSIYQILYMDKVPDYAAVNEGTNLAGLVNPKWRKFANGLLRNIAKNKKKDLFIQVNNRTIHGMSIMYSHPQWLVKRYKKAYGTRNCRAIMEFNNSKPPLSFWVNPRHKDARDFYTNFKNKLKLIRSELCPIGLVSQSRLPDLMEIASVEPGFIYPQNELSMSIPFLLDLDGYVDVLDACAAPGGKTMLMSIITQGKARITAMDISQQRIELLRKNLQVFGIPDIELIVGDSAEPREDFISRFDRILLDVPCSNLGVVQRHPDIRWRRMPDDIDKFARLQSRLLDVNARYLKPGGKLLYSACTFEPEETTSVIKDFMKKNKSFALTKILINEFNKGIKGLLDSKGQVLCLPFKHKRCGFFAALLEKLC